MDEGYISIHEKWEVDMALSSVRLSRRWADAWDGGSAKYIVRCSFSTRAFDDFMWFIRNFVKVKDAGGGWLVSTAGALRSLLRRHLEARMCEAEEVHSGDG